MISAWYKHITDVEEQNRFKNSVLGSKLVLNRLQALIKEMKEDVDNQELSIKTYDTPNWSAKQAHLNGFKEALKKINMIITLDPQENK